MMPNIHFVNGGYSLEDQLFFIISFLIGSFFICSYFINQSLYVHFLYSSLFIGLNFYTVLFFNSTICFQKNLATLSFAHMPIT